MISRYWASSNVLSMVVRMLPPLPSESAILANVSSLNEYQVVGAHRHVKGGYLRAVLAAQVPRASRRSGESLIWRMPWSVQVLSMT